MPLQLPRLPLGAAPQLRSPRRGPLRPPRLPLGAAPQLRSPRRPRQWTAPQEPRHAQGPPARLGELWPPPVSPGASGVLRVACVLPPRVAPTQAPQLRLLWQAPQLRLLWRALAPQLRHGVFFLSGVFCWPVPSSSAPAPQLRTLSPLPPRRPPFARTLALALVALAPQCFHPPSPPVPCGALARHGEGATGRGEEARRQARSSLKPLLRRRPLRRSPTPTHPPQTPPPSLSPSLHRCWRPFAGWTPTRIRWRSCLALSPWPVLPQLRQRSGLSWAATAAAVPERRRVWRWPPSVACVQ